MTDCWKTEATAAAAGALLCINFAVLGPDILSHYSIPSPPPASANCIHQSTSLALSCLCAAAAVAGAQCPFPMIMCVDRQTHTRANMLTTHAETHFRQDCIASMVMMHINLATRRALQTRLKLDAQIMPKLMDNIEIKREREREMPAFISTT